MKSTTIEKVENLLNDIAIETIGRYVQGDSFWTDQLLQSVKEVLQK